MDKTLCPFSKEGVGGGSFPNPNFSRNFFVMFMFGHFSERGGGLPNTKLFEELFCFCLDIFQERGGGLPCSKTFEELFCLSLNIFQEEGGVGCLIPKMMRYSFLLWVRHFPRKMGEDDQNPKTLKIFREAFKKS